MSEKKQYILIQSFILEKYYISTIYRKCSAIIEDIWYYETIIWEWDAEKKKRGEMLEMHDSGLSSNIALKNHFQICEKLLKKENKNNEKG